MTRATMRRALCVTMLGAVAALAGCLGPADEGDGPEPTGKENAALSGHATVEHAVENSCSTSSVRGLSLQIIAEARCLNPDAFEKLPTLANLHTDSIVFPYLEKRAHDALVAALKAHPTRSLHVESMLRTISQQ